MVSVLMASLQALAKSVLIAFLICGLSSSAFAQQAPSANGSSDARPPSSGPRKQLATILFAGLGGAILGLSTLSFYGRPQDKLSNIAIGFAFGVISGTAYVTYRAASNPAEIYGLQLHDEFGRGRWSQANALAVKAPLAAWEF